MAIDSRIALQARAADISPALNIFENALNNSQNRELRQAQEERAQALAPLQLQQAQQAVTANQQTMDENTENRIIRSISEFGTKLKPVIESGNIDQAQSMLTNRLLELQSQGLPTNETVDAITALRNNDPQSVVRDIDTIQTIAQQRGLFAGGAGQTAGQREFASLTEGLSGEDKAKASRISLGLDPRASASAQERIATSAELGAQVATQAGAESEAKEVGKSKAQLKFAPQIKKAVKLAENAAAERGEVLTDLSRMEASLPGVKDAVKQLRELAPMATSTLGGRAFDFAVKESGFGSTKGADARAKFIAIIDNQVLPLLKETFGAAFTVQEGENLKASLADPNASPDQKTQQLDAFIAQKERNIRSKQAQLGDGNQGGDVSDLSDEDLFN